MNDDSPNKAIDQAIALLMEKIGYKDPEIAVKVINSAIAWEKVKHNIRDKTEQFDPDTL